jgi:hypothetical protein
MVPPRTVKIASSAAVRLAARPKLEKMIPVIILSDSPLLSTQMAFNKQIPNSVAVGPSCDAYATRREKIVAAKNSIGNSRAVY